MHWCVYFVHTVLGVKIKTYGLHWNISCRIYTFHYITVNITYSAMLYKRGLAILALPAVHAQIDCTQSA